MAIPKLSDEKYQSIVEKDIQKCVAAFETAFKLYK
jgi:hypothetical protein